MTDPHALAEKIVKDYFGSLGAGVIVGQIESLLREAIGDAVRSALDHPDTKIWGYTKQQMLEIIRWKKMNAIPTLWVDHALEPTVATLLRSERAAAYSEGLNANAFYVSEKKNWMNEGIIAGQKIAYEDCERIAKSHQCTATDGRTVILHKHPDLDLCHIQIAKDIRSRASELGKP